jgi:hypothetical protein
VITEKPSVWGFLDQGENVNDTQASEGSAKSVAGFFHELRRRYVIQVAIAYLIIAWLLTQVVVVIEAPLSLPVWTDTLVIVILGVGFPVALFLAWAYNLTHSNAGSFGMCGDFC